MKIGENSRGFDRVDFKDKYKNECSLQKSSIASEDCIWLGVDKDAHGNNLSTRMHLTRNDVETLMVFLSQFLLTGEIFPPPPK